MFTPASGLGSPDIFDSNTTNATLALAPGETDQIIIRGNLSPSDMQTLIGNLTPVVVSHAAQPTTMLDVPYQFVDQKNYPMQDTLLHWR